MFLDVLFESRDFHGGGVFAAPFLTGGTSPREPLSLLRDQEKRLLFGNIHGGMARRHNHPSQFQRFPEFLEHVHNCAAWATRVSPHGLPDGPAGKVSTPAILGN